MAPEFLVNFNLRPFRQPIQTHGDVSFLRHGIDLLVSVAYYFYHVPSVLVGFFPWSVFLGPAIVQTFRSLRAKRRQCPFYAQHRGGPFRQKVHVSLLAPRLDEAVSGRRP